MTKNGLRHGIGYAVYRALALLHTFQQAGLSTRCGAVNLIRQQDIGKNRTGAELEGLLLLIVVVDTAELRRQ